MPNQMTPPNLSRMSLQSLERVQEKLIRRKGELGRWEDVAAEIGVSIGTVCRVAGGYYPRHAELAAKFGLPALGLGALCPLHGRVCAVKHRASNMAAKPRPKRIYIRKPLNTVWPVNTLEW